MIKDLLKVVLKSIWQPRMHKSKREQNHSVHILGTGPSMNDSIQFIMNEISADTMVLNDFAYSDYYVSIKPKYYILIDPVYWAKPEDVHREGLIEREKLFDCLIEKTLWDTTIFIPSAGYRLGWIEQRLYKNQYIKIQPVNIYDITPRESKFYYFLINKNFTTPSQNVLATSLIVAILLGYKNIGLHGAEHSWTENMKVNDNNIVCHVNKHFYDEPEVLIPWVNSNGRPLKLFELYSALAKTFKSYNVINGYATSQKVKIINYTPGSYIDAFERSSLR